MKFCNQHHPLSLPPFPIVEHKLSQRSSRFGGNFRVEEENCRLGWSWNPSKRSFDLCTRKKKPHLELMHPNKSSIGQFGNSEEYYSTSSTTCQRHENHAAPSERIVVLALPATSSPQWKELKQRKPRQPRIKSKKIEIHEQDNKQKSPPFTFMFTEWQGRQKRDTNRVRRMIKRVSSDMHDVHAQVYEI
eukprot:XP_010651298.1 PREDICTED: uncharacterized protein LOC100251835 isoform X2 [Vitis vinifera]